MQDEFQEIFTPGLYTDVDVQLCVYAENGKVWADAVVYWDGPDLPHVARFDVFEFRPKLEFKDAEQEHRDCFPKEAINSENDGDYPCTATPKATYGGGPYWTADATVRYNINNDGLGDRLWPLTGSPAV